MEALKDGAPSPSPAPTHNPDRTAAEVRRRGHRRHHGYSHSAQVVEVTVDEETGEVSVDKVWVAHDCGKALNRLSVEGQAGLGVMGMGQP